MVEEKPKRLMEQAQMRRILDEHRAERAAEVPAPLETHAADGNQRVEHVAGSDRHACAPERAAERQHVIRYTAATRG
jgi:hypothetical protein